MDIGQIEIFTRHSALKRVQSEAAIAFIS